MSFILLNLAFLLGCAVLCLCVFSKNPAVYKVIAFAAAFIEALLMFSWFVASDLTQIVQASASITVLQDPKIAISFAASDLSVLFGLFISLAAFAAIAVPCSKHGAEREYYASLLGLEFCALGCFFSGDYLVFSVFWLLSAVPLTFLIGIFKKDETDNCALRTFVYLVLSALPLLIVCGALYAKTASMAFGPLADAAKDYPKNFSHFIGLSVFAAAVMRVIVFPLHLWLRNPFLKMSAQSCMLVFPVLHLTSLYLIVVNAQVFPSVFKAAAPWLLLFAVIGAVYGAVMALAQSSLRLAGFYTGLVFSSLSLAAFSCGSKIGIAGSIYASSAFLWAVTGFFAIVAIAEDRFKSSSSKLSGLFTAMPKFATFSMIILFTFAAVPLLPGFNAFFMTLSAVLAVKPAYAFVLSFAMLLCAAAAMKFTAQIFWGSSSVKRFAGDLSFYEAAVMAFITILLIVLGAVPSVIFEQVNLSVNFLQSLM